MQNGQGRERRPFALLVNPDATTYAAFQKLYRGGVATPGASASYTNFSNGNRWNTPNRYQITWTVLGFETLETATGEFDTLLLERRETNDTYTFQGRRRYWIDTSTGLPLKATETVERGLSNFTPYQAIHIRTGGRDDAVPIKGETP